jgi:hypothetical protein
MTINAIIECFNNPGDCICGITFNIAYGFGLSAFWPSCGEFQPRPKNSPTEVFLVFGVVIVGQILLWLFVFGANKKTQALARFEQSPPFKEWFRTYMHLAHECDVPILETLWKFDYGSHGMSEAQLYHDLIADVCRFLKTRGFIATPMGFGWRAQHLRWSIAHPDGRIVSIYGDIVRWTKQPRFRLIQANPMRVQDIVRISSIPGVEPLTHPEFRKYLFNALWDTIVDGKRFLVDRW